MSHASHHTTDSSRYAKCIEVSKRIRWDTDRDVIRGRQFDFGKTFLPDGLSKVTQLPFLSADQTRLFSQLQGRTYANMFALVERFIGAKVLEISRGHWLGDQVALEALVRLTDEELKHQEMFRRLETMIAPGMPAGYQFLPQPNDVASAVLAASTWAVLGLTLDIELFSQAHYRSSIDPETQIDPLWKDVFLFHWKEESQHAIVDEMEWMRENDSLDSQQRDQAVDELIGLVGAVDGIVQMQAKADAEYFVESRRPRIRPRAVAGDPRNDAGRLSLAVHRERCSGSALPRGARLDDQCRAGRSHQRRACADRRRGSLESWLRGAWMCDTHAPLACKPREKLLQSLGHRLHRHRRQQKSKDASGDVKARDAKPLRDCVRSR